MAAIASNIPAIISPSVANEALRFCDGWYWWTGNKADRDESIEDNALMRVCVCVCVCEDAHTRTPIAPATQEAQGRGNAGISCTRTV